MNRDQLARGIIASCTWLTEPYVVVFGSQSILGSLPDDLLPSAATRSREMDVTPWSAVTGASTPDEVAEKLVLIDVRLGEGSDFDLEHGFYVDAIPKETVILPTGWDNRLVKFDADPEIEYGAQGFCLNPVDLCVAKLMAGRDHDREFVDALIDTGIVTADETVQRIESGIDWPGGYEFDTTVTVSRAVNFLRR